MEEQKPSKEDIENLQQIRKLGKTEEFRIWRNLIVDNNILTLEAELAGPDADSMPEAVLRGKLKHINSLKYFFHDVFDNVEQQLKDLNN